MLGWYAYIGINSLNIKSRYLLCPQTQDKPKNNKRKTAGINISYHRINRIDTDHSVCYCYANLVSTTTAPKSFLVSDWLLLATGQTTVVYNPPVELWRHRGVGGDESLTFAHSLSPGRLLRHSIAVNRTISYTKSSCQVCFRDGRFGSKAGQMRQLHWNLIWKSPGFVPFGANLTRFGAKPTIPVW